MYKRHTPKRCSAARVIPRHSGGAVDAVNMSRRKKGTLRLARVVFTPCGEVDPCLNDASKESLFNLNPYEVPGEWAQGL